MGNSANKNFFMLVVGDFILSDTGTYILKICSDVFKDDTGVPAKIFCQGDACISKYFSNTFSLGNKRD